MYSYDEIRQLILKENGRPYQISSFIYTDDIKDWICENIKGECTFQGKLWCIAHNLKEVPICANENCNKNTAYHNKFNEGFRKFCSDPKCKLNHPDTRETYKKTSQKNWGTDNPLQNKEHRDTIKNIMKERYGHHYAMQSNDIKEKYANTSLERYGVNHPFKNSDIKSKAKLTLIQNIGVPYPSQNRDIMKIIMNSRLIRTRSYENNLYYQSSYELYFLELMKSYGFLSLLENGLTFKYTYDNKPDNLYVSDFYIPSKNEIIEIKSNWTFNKNGNDKFLENKNLAKKTYVENQGFNFKFLIGRDQIEEYVNTFNSKLYE